MKNSNIKMKNDNAKIKIYIVLNGILFLLLFGLMPFFAKAATYYVDASRPDDLSNGLTPETAWKTIDKVNKSSFLPGDNILFKRGEIWREQLGIPSSGNTGSPITFGAYGNGENPVINGAEPLNGSWSQYSGNIYRITIADIPWIVVDGETVLHYNAGNYASLSLNQWDYNSGYLYANFGQDPVNENIQIGSRYYGISTNLKSNIIIENFTIKYPMWYDINISKPSSNIIVRNCTLLPAGEHNNSVFLNVFHSGSVTIAINGNSKADPQTMNIRVENCISEGNIGGYRSSYVHIKGCTVNNGTIYMVFGDHFTVENNTVGQIQAQATDHFIARGNKLTGWWTGGAFNLEPADYDWSDILIEDNEISNDFFAGIWIAGSDGHTISDVVIRRNIIHNVGENNPRHAPTGGIRLDYSVKNAMVYNNIIYNCGDRVGIDTGGIVIKAYNILTPGGPDNIKVFNNTLYDNGYAQITFSDWNLGATNVSVKNNIFYANSSLVMSVGSSGQEPSNVWDYNIYYRSSGLSDPLIFFGGTTYTANQFSSYKSARGTNEQHSIASDPLFNDRNQKDFSLSANSPAMDTGTNVGLTSDYAGNTVPQGAAPDIGAYEYIGAAPEYSPSDLNSDNFVNLLDFGILKSDFLKLTANLANPKSDIDGDGQATIKDVGIMMSGWK